MAERTVERARRGEKVFANFSADFYAMIELLVSLPTLRFLSLLVLFY